MTNNTCGYEVSIDHVYADETPVAGCGCDGPARTVADIIGIGACSLTPGDPSPIGRCPDCEELVYVDTPKTRATEAAPDLLAALEDALDDLNAFRRAIPMDKWPDKPVVHTMVRDKAVAAIAKAKGGAA